MHSAAGRGIHTSHTHGYGWSPLVGTWAQHEGLTLLPPATFSFPSPAAASVEKAEMASLLCNARECPSGGWVQGRALGHLDLC